MGLMVLAKKEGPRREFCNRVLKWGKVEMLMHLDFTLSLSTIKKARLLAKLKPVIDPGILQLVESFLDLPLVDYKGRYWPVEDGVPTAGPIACVLLNFYLDEWDRTFIKRFPHLPFVRHAHEVAVSIPHYCIGRERKSIFSTK